MEDDNPSECEKSPISPTYSPAVSSPKYDQQPISPTCSPVFSSPKSDPISQTYSPAFSPEMTRLDAEGSDTSTSSFNSDIYVRVYGQKRKRSPDPELCTNRDPARKNLENNDEIHAPSTSTHVGSELANSNSYPNLDPTLMPQYNMCNTWNYSGAPYFNSSMPAMDLLSTSSGINNNHSYVPSLYGTTDGNCHMAGYLSMDGNCPMVGNGHMLGNCYMPGNCSMHGNFQITPHPKVDKVFNGGVLVAPRPEELPPPRQNKPNGCKTVFVGGLPDKHTEEIIKEAFADCGEIATVRMSKKNFCHIRFESEDSVESAMKFSGYRLKIENTDGAVCRIHVDYATARDDQYEYECKMRALLREEHHQSESLRPLLRLNGPYYEPYGTMAGNGPMWQFPAMPPKVDKVFYGGILVAPLPEDPVPTRRNKPIGCKTVFVGGLPEKFTEEIIREAFSDCGGITDIRMSKKNFCYVRFESELSVESAMYFSGYRLKIENKDDVAYSSRIHVDYAITRDDQNDYEYMMHYLHPPPIVKYSEKEAENLGEKLRDEESFEKGCTILSTWLDVGECNKRNCGDFYSLIQSVYSQIDRLEAEKRIIEDKVAKAKQGLHKKCEANARLFKTIEKVFKCASVQKAWDCFTKAQRKKLEYFKRHLTDIQEGNSEALLDGRIEEEMEMSDSDDKKSTEELATVNESIKKLQEENELLRNELQATKEESKEKIGALNSTYQMMHRNYLETKTKLEEAEKERPASENHRPKKKKKIGNNPASREVSESDVRLVSLISTFLISHPLGASIEYICSYLKQMDQNINLRDVENVMKKFETVFKEETSGIGATLEKKWVFYGYKFYTSPSS